MIDEKLREIVKAFRGDCVGHACYLDCDGCHYFTQAISQIKALVIESLGEEKPDGRYITKECSCGENR